MKTTDIISFSVDGEKLTAKSGETIIDALISSGKNIVGKVGCKGGVCGACLCTVKRAGEKPFYALACREVPEIGDEVTFIRPEFKGADYDFSKIQFSGDLLKKVFPEIDGCISCKQCDFRCVKGISVMEMIEFAREGNYKKVAELTYNCIECGACSIGCPAKINHAEVSLLARRINAKFL